MGEFLRIEKLFDSFRMTLPIQEMSIEEIKIINIIKGNFDKIVPIGTAQGKRITVINEIIEIEKDSTSAILYDCDSEVQKTIKGEDDEVLRLSQITMQNFRGALSRVELPIHPISFIYGSNGSGKSTICEALEFCLLGSISEAQRKRIALNKYVHNPFAQTEPLVKLMGLTIEGNEVEISPNIEKYQFSFIEKNRLDDFARVSAKQPDEQRRTLSVLFGIDAFEAFINGFTMNPEEKMQIQPVFQQQWEEVQKQIEALEATIKNNEKELEQINNEEKTILEKFPFSSSLQDVIEYLDGSNDEKETREPGRIEQLDAEITKLLATQAISYDDSEAINLIANIKENHNQYLRVGNEIGEQQASVNLRILYDAVIAVKEQFPDKCPVCETPFDKSCVHPYEHAQSQLVLLKSIFELELKHKQYGDKIIIDGKKLVRSVDELKSTLKNISGAEYILNTLDTMDIYSAGSAEDYNKMAKESLSECFAKGREEIENHNKIASSNQKAIETIDMEKQELLKIRDTINNIKIRRAVFEKQNDDSQAEIDKILIKNVQLGVDVEEEKQRIIEKEKYITAYRKIVTRLRQYRIELFRSVVDGLNQKTLHFYNLINATDPKHEKLASVNLPTEPEQPILISFQDNPKQTVDGLLLLSEGHIRCLGLSILLAKVVRDDLKFVIFDDIVNAIDDEHRAGIRRVLFECPEMEYRQFLLTSHSENFVKDLENMFPFPQMKCKVNRINLLPSPNRGIELSADTKHYVTLAKQAVCNGNKAEALYKDRQAIENIGNKLWRNMVNKDIVGLLSVKVDRNGKIEAKSKIEALCKALENVSSEYWVQIREKLKKLLEHGTKHPKMWKYLNGGTHEESDCEEFEMDTVRFITDLIGELELMIKR